MVARTRAGSRLYAGLGAAALTLSSAVGLASPDYPAALSDLLELDRTPACTLCHSDDIGGENTVTTRFGKTLLALGAEGKSQNSLRSAVTDSESENYDSDSDGVGDVQELLDGSDPNRIDREPPEPDGSAGSPGEGSPAPQAPPSLSDVPLAQTGCSWGARPSTGSAPALLCLLLLGACRRRRRRRIGCTSSAASTISGNRT